MKMNEKGFPLRRTTRTRPTDLIRKPQHPGYLPRHSEAIKWKWRTADAFFKFMVTFGKFSRLTYGNIRTGTDDY